MLLRADLADFFRNLRSSLGGRPFPYVWVPEWHKTGHGLHAHFACGQHIKRSVVEEAWGRGFIKMKLLGDLPSTATSLDEARVAARYLAKYIGKDFDQIRTMGLHRYDCAEGFEPRKFDVPGPTLREAVEGAAEIMGGPPATISTSDQWTGWTGPIAVAMSWAS